MMAGPKCRPGGGSPVYDRSRYTASLAGVLSPPGAAGWRRAAQMFRKKISMCPWGVKEDFMGEANSPELS